MRKGKKSLGETHPEVARQWHPTKNGDLTPNDFTKGSKSRVWWKCDKGDDHEWETTIGNRTSGSNCPICRGLKVVLSNCFATKKPLISKQWHPTKNGNLTPYDFTTGSRKKAWWKCPEEEDHEWETAIVNRTIGSNCPYCSGNKVSMSNCFATKKPLISKQWHPTKNGNLTPYDFTAGSRKKVWWKCPEGEDHEWISSICDRKTYLDGCPICSGHKVVKSNCLATTHPELAKQWHPTLNGKLTPYNVKAGVFKKVWWKCPEGEDHEWKARIGNRTNHNSGCAVCSGHKVVKSNCLATTHPELAKEWHPTKNGNITPYDVKSTDQKKVWWKCPKGDDHEWLAMPGNRGGKGSGCSVCANITVVLSNCLATTHPELAKEWHPTKNGNLTPFDVSSGSNKKIWWKCNYGDDHEWVSRTADRADNHNCPYCTLTPQSKQELTITFELIKLFKSIDPKGLKTKLEGRLRAIDIFIPKLNLCVEFDGAYWHKDDRQKDKIKSEMVLDKGFKLIRVREEPLKKIYDTDVISKQPYNGKQITNDILSTIMSMYDLDNLVVSKIKEYQAKDDLQNEKGLERYIDKILTEKAENKSNKANTAI